MNPSLESLYRNHRQGLFSIAASITGSHQLAEDAIHNAFARLIKSDLPEGEQSVGFVYKSVKNAAIDLLRSKQRNCQLSDSLFNGYYPNDRESESPDAKLLNAEVNRKLREAVDELVAEQREAIVLKAFGQLTFEQAAEVAGVPVKTLATRYRRALSSLAEKLNAEN